MLKRIFWLTLAAALGWLLWRLWRQRQEDFGATTPLLAPLEPFGRHIPAPPAPPAPAAAPAPAVGAPPLPVELPAAQDAVAEDAPAQPPDVAGKSQPAPQLAEPPAAQDATAEDTHTRSPIPPAVELPAAQDAPAEDTHAQASDAASAVPQSAEPPVAQDAAAEHPHAPAQDADLPDASALGDVMGYCPRCKAKRLINGAHEEMTESGRRAARGTCAVCGGNMFTFLPSKANG